MKSAGVVARYGERSYTLVACRECGARFAEPFSSSDVDYEEIQRRHAGYIHTAALNEYIRSILSNCGGIVGGAEAIRFLTQRTQSDSRFLRALEICVRAHAERRRLRILEVGCNLGYFGGIVQRFGHEYTGLDVQPAVIARAREYYGEHYQCMTVESFAATDVGQFDLVCSFEVIEHVPDPRGFFDRCLSLVSTGGTLLLSTPNGDLAADGTWLPIDLPPIHLSLFGRRSFLALANTHIEIVFPRRQASTSDHTNIGWLVRRYGTILRRRITPSVAPQADPRAPDFYAGIPAAPCDYSLWFEFRSARVLAINWKRTLRATIAVVIRPFFTIPPSPLVVEIIVKRP